MAGQILEVKRHCILLEDIARFLPDLASVIDELIVSLPANEDTPLQHPITVLSHHNGQSENMLVQRLAFALEQNYQDISVLQLDPHHICQWVPEAFARLWQVLPLEKSSNTLVIAHCEPFENRWVDWLSKIYHCQILPTLVSPSRLSQLIESHYRLYTSVLGANESFSFDNSFSSDHHLLNQQSSQINEANVVKIVNWILSSALERNASDIHLEPGSNGFHMRLRIDDMLLPFHHFDRPLTEPLSNRLKIMANLDIAEHRQPQDGRFSFQDPSFQKKKNSHECRISVLPVMSGEKIVIRIQHTQILRSFTEMGMGELLQAQWTELIHQNAGLILVTGPTGSGKTSTLYASLQSLLDKKINITTIEDPIELPIPAFNQMAVNADIGLSFASGLRAILRQDPNVIMVGEIRDSETAEIALQAALTGHLVLSTVHTIDSVTAVIRLMELGVPSYVIRATLLGVLSQRLVRTICPHCRMPDKQNYDKQTSDKETSVCAHCLGLGFLGRTGVFELLTLDSLMREKIQENMSAQRFRSELIGRGMRTLRENAQMLIDAGMSTESEILRVYPSFLDEISEFI